MTFGYHDKMGKNHEKQKLHIVASMQCVPTTGPADYVRDVVKYVRRTIDSALLDPAATAEACVCAYNSKILGD